VTGALALRPSEVALVAALEGMGWELLTCEIDMHSETARVEIKRFDGRLVTLDARNGKATVTREQQRWTTAKIGRRGDECRVDRLGTEFLGREHCLGPRHALKKMCTYLADNPAPGRPALPAQDVRRLVAPLMGAS